MKESDYWGGTRRVGDFSYKEAFSRNIGWITDREQAVLGSKRVAIAGMGGVGGYHLLTLLRLGVQKFRIADLDVFEVANFNRQAGASVSTLGKDKVHVLADMARDINPQVDMQLFAAGVDEKNLDEFFQDVDLYVDGLDFFAFGAREAVFAFCGEHGIPAITAAPLGMSSAFLAFLPGHVGFEDYFRVAGHDELEKAVRFLVGLAPALLHRHYLVDPTCVDLRARKGPSTVIACQLCAGMAAAESIKILLNRGKVWAAPYGLQFDAYHNRCVRTWRPGGNRNLMNRLAIALAKRQLEI